MGLRRPVAHLAPGTDWQCSMPEHLDKAMVGLQSPLGWRLGTDIDRRTELVLRCCTEVSYQPSKSASHTSFRIGNLADCLKDQPNYPTGIIELCYI